MRAFHKRAAILIANKKLVEMECNVMSTMMVTTDSFVLTYPQEFFWSGTEIWHI